MARLPAYTKAAFAFLILRCQVLYPGRVGGLIVRDFEHFWMYDKENVVEGKETREN